MQFRKGDILRFSDRAGVILIGKVLRNPSKIRWSFYHANIQLEIMEIIKKPEWFVHKIGQHYWGHKSMCNMIEFAKGPKYTWTKNKNKQTITLRMNRRK